MGALIPLALSAWLGSGVLPSPWRLLDEAGQPFALRPPEVDLAPETIVEATVKRPTRLDLFAPRVPEYSDAPFRRDGIPVNDKVTNVLLFTGGAVLLGTILADWAKHQHW
jgi:hypothetical protein